MKKICAFFLVALCMVNCTSDPYESGDGKYSYLTAEFVELHTTVSKVSNFAVTDNDVMLQFAPSLACEWAVVADSVYRALLYYNIDKGQQTVKPVAATAIPVIRWRTVGEAGTTMTDPVVFQSAWIGNNGKYLNIGMGLKTGTDSELPENTRQTIGMACDSIVSQDDGSCLYCLRLLHAQNNVPQYYTSRIFASVPLQELRKGDKIQLTVNTYDGVVVKTLSFNP